jgi:hypothetical protein
VPSILAATWNDGVFVFGDDTRRHELPGRSVRALARDDDGATLAIIDGHELCRRTRHGAWSTIATSQLDLACLTVVGDTIYVGTDDARVLRVRTNGATDPLNGFESIPGRDTWYAGSAMINGERVGPPLGVRSMTATSDGAALLANVHVGGIARSTDGGATWHSTIDVHSDVHEVCAHPHHPRIVIAAAAVGLCVSHDAGATWTIEQHGLHARYCSAVAFLNEYILVAASADHFAPRGAVYRRPLDASTPLELVPALPEWFGGIVDTGCIATLGSAIAIADKAGNLYASTDAGHSWLRREAGLPMLSSVLVADGTPAGAAVYS